MSTTTRVPFEETRRGHQYAVGAKRVGKHANFRDGLSLRIDRPPRGTAVILVLDRPPDVFGPVRVVDGGDPFAGKYFVSHLIAVDVEVVETVDEIEVFDHIVF